MKYSHKLSALLISVIVVGLLLFVQSCSKKNDNPPKPTIPDTTTVTYKSINAFQKLSFDEPVDLQNAGDNSNKLFVAERAGKIYAFANDSLTETKTVFLDIIDKVQSNGDEQGLLGLAFHPNYKSNGYFYVNYTATNPERSVIARFKVSGDANVADKSSELVLLEYAQPFSNHNGGQLAFGPDGFLYIGVGDGGSGGDPNGNGQNRKALLGKILRIDVDNSQGDLPYAIPGDNPFVSNESGYREEIYAYGMRNPWRFNFDSETGKLWAGDVGQNQYEEIDVIEKGENYGWNTMEGTHCYNASSCDQTGLTLPIYDYSHDVGVSIIGGFIYRGAALPKLVGNYIYTDYGSKKVWRLDVTNLSKPVNTLLFNTDYNPSSFGVDEKKNLYVVGLDGSVYKIVTD